MLIEFSVANFLSIKDRQTLRMDAASVSDHPERVIEAGRYKLLRSAAIYGANASGKSNVLKAMGTMREIVTTSARRSSADEIDVTPFLLSTATEHAPSLFEAVMLIDGVQYRYGFEADRKAVRAEWLFETKIKQEKMLFVREGDAIEIAKAFKEGKDLEEKTRDNALFLAVCDQFNGPVSQRITTQINRWQVTSGLNYEKSKFFFVFSYELDAIRDLTKKFLAPLNLGFVDVILQEKDLETFAMETNKNFSKLTEVEKSNILRMIDAQIQDKAFLRDVKTIHSKYDLDGTKVAEVKFDLDSQESSGTNKIVALSAELIAVIGSGGLAIIDELDAKLHPLLTQAIIGLFNDPVTNPRNAQLIFATHDTNLLTYGNFRRDQIWFTEKDQYGATCLYSLVEYKEPDGTKVRKDRSFETDYIQGRYGAIPFIGDFSKLFGNGAESKD
jgi:uncharacterized protein